MGSIILIGDRPECQTKWSLDKGNQHECTLHQQDNLGRQPGPRTGVRGTTPDPVTGNDSGETNIDIIFDVDGTLFDITHRVGLIRPPDGGRKDWKAFRAQAHRDAPIVEIIWLAKVLFNQHDARLIITTGRLESERELTRTMLAELGVNAHAMYMRSEGDFRPDHEVKLSLLVQMRGEGYNPVLVFDDRATVVNMWRAEGIRCLQVAPGEF